MTARLDNNVLWRPIEIVDGVAYVNWRGADVPKEIVLANRGGEYIYAQGKAKEGKNEHNSDKSGQCDQ